MLQILLVVFIYRIQVGNFVESKNGIIEIILLKHISKAKLIISSLFKITLAVKSLLANVLNAILADDFSLQYLF